MKSFDTKNNRKSLRLQSYDYSSAGYYFITICTKNRELLFGKIEKGHMIVNELGKIARRYWQMMPVKYSNIRIEAFVVMPNHVHGIIHIQRNINPTVGAIYEMPLRMGKMYKEAYRKRRRQMQLSKIIGWYKMNVSREINQKYDIVGASCWQRNYYEHIIRNQESLNSITEYIARNPELWGKDRFYQK